MMAEQKQATKTAIESKTSSESKAKNLKDEELAKATDELIDEIEEVLEDATLALNYTQRGGE